MEAVASYNKKYLRMKPEVRQIFEDLELFQDFVRMQYPAVKFDPTELYRNTSLTWQKFCRTRNRQYYVNKQQ